MQNRDGLKFCEDCGARLALTCQRCEAEVSPGKKFCGSCGAPVNVQAANRFASPEVYTPKHLAEKILTSKSALEGERKQVTVLFADLKGSMELLADRDPEEARKLLDPVLEHMMEAAHRYEGTVNQVMGDGIMALFGAPLAHEDHAVRACYAALRMQESVKRYAEGVRRTEGIPIQIRVGLNSGEVVVRSIGSDLHMDYTAVGQTTHLAARMEQLATPGSILLSGEALRLAEGYVQVKALGPIPVKGLSEPVEVWEVVGGGSVRTRLQAAAMRGFNRFVGRDAEMEQLRHGLQQASDGRGQVVGVVGEPGVGKSRLFYEFTHSHRTRDWLILESGSASYGKATPYLPVIDLMKSYFQIETRDDARKIREKVSGKLVTLDQSLMPTMPAVLTLLDSSVEDSQWQALDSHQRRQRTLDAVKHLLLRESQVQPLCLVFEDLHWIDSETQAFLDSLVESLPTAQLLLLFNYRPEYQHGWGSKTYYTQLRIDPLTPESAHELLENLLGADTGLQQLKELLIKRTDGNPFFLEESVRTLVETKALVGERGSYQLATELPSIQVPATVQAVLAARIDRLPPEDKRLLQSASVIGENVPFTLLQAVVEMPEEELHSHVSRLQAVEFLYETGLYPEIEYTFKHGLTYQVAYNSLLVERRRTLHVKILEAIEVLHADRLAEQVERLAHHAFRGEVWEKAATYLRQAGTRAADRWAHREAAAYFEQSLEALQRLPQSREMTEQAIDIRLELRSSLWALREPERIIHHLREAETLAEALGDQRRLLRISADMISYFYNLGDGIHAVEIGERALSTATALGDFALQVQLKGRLARAYTFMGNYRRAIDFLRWTIASVKDELLHERFDMSTFHAHSSHGFLAQCLAELGEFDEGIGSGEEGIHLAEADNDTQGLANTYANLGFLYLVRGDLAMATPLLERAVEVCRIRHVPVVFQAAASLLGYTYLNSGRVAQALELLEEAVGFSGGRRHNDSLNIARLSEGYLRVGRIDAAVEHAQRALDLARQTNEKGGEAYALRVVGEIAAHKDPSAFGEAEDRYHQAIAVADELGMRPLIAQCHLGLGRLYRRMDNLEQAKRHLTTATSMMREMQMGLWLEQAEAELKGLR
jgi:class 3 adenylate cyclase/tetratricopeptide (TPR) repeat protein